MNDRPKRFLKIWIDKAGRPFCYRGWVIGEDDRFISIKDILIGEIQFNKNNVISIQEVPEPEREIKEDRR